MKIIVDADACPKTVLQACIDLGRKYEVEVWTVASFNHRIENQHHIVVGNSPQEADIKIANISQPGDIGITQDWGLAAILLGRGLHCLGPSGQEYTPQNIDFLLAERDIKAKFRRSGGRTPGPKKRNIDQDARFAASLEEILRKKP